MSTNVSTSMSSDSNSNSNSQTTNSSPYWVKMTSGSVGSIVTALAVTPLEVVKVRQQQQAYNTRSTSTTSSLPSNVSLCPRGCGTFVLNNGISDCVLPKSAVPYFDATSGKLKEMTTASAKRTTNSNYRSSSNSGTFSTLRRIFLQEGVSGIYAGLGATLVMGVPNTVLYFVSYDELISHLRSNRYGYEKATWMPAVAGATARLLASLSTA
jgi:solute carrier family 25 protein 39/40